MLRILAVIDMQKDFIDGSLGTPEAAAITAPLASFAANWEGPVIFTRDTHGADYMRTQEGEKLPVPHCIRYTSGWEIEQSLQVPSAQVFDKNTFGSLDLTHHLLMNACTEVELVGVCTDICVVSNALLIKAYLPETIVRVDSSCCAGTTPDNHQKALDVMRQCQVEII